MEQNPLHSSDLNYGVPHLFNEMMDEILDNTHSTDLDELIKDLLETTTKTTLPLESTGASNGRDIRRQFGTSCGEEPSEMDDSPNKQAAPRYTEALHRTVSGIGAAPQMLLSKKK